MIKSINPLSAALSPENNFYDNLFKTETLPHVWVSSLVTGQSLASHFTRLYSPAVPPKRIPVGHHILSLDPDTPEAIWKSIAYDLLNVGCIVCISQLGEFAKQPLEWYLADLPSSDVAMHLLTSQVDWVEWVEALSEIPLTLKEALELAELALVKLNDIEQLNIELDSLRRRAKVSEYSLCRAVSLKLGQMDVNLKVIEIENGKAKLAFEDQIAIQFRGSRPRKVSLNTATARSTPARSTRSRPRWRCGSSATRTTRRDCLPEMRLNTKGTKHTTDTKKNACNTGVSPVKALRADHAFTAKAPPC
jgi:hypothetical protein